MQTIVLFSRLTGTVYIIIYRSFYTGMTNIEIIESFFTAFGNRNHQAMNALYSDDIVYSDPLFGMLEGQQVMDKWEMICRDIRDFRLTVIKSEEIDHEYATCQWKATWYSSRSKKQIVFDAKSFMRFGGGKIIEHSDGFSLTKWIAQAYGLRGQFFGWLNFMKRKVQREYRGRLERFSVSKPLFATGDKRTYLSDSFDQ
ncbi:Ketosteroid isomerase-related protein [Niabella drilacis]|uniref:Ketosteroid isomerase-related protein n=2 Tax=Niabella drilacis (strain DSM 25811 / CCM 8410 / CCUG 62505 / LMG 26954 / E90) TaxID=1285928 RepID=A0A1G6U433_NIADE|nr:Ketosteroid isomerase-related protein [Niabella drilacis]